MDMVTLYIDGKKLQIVKKSTVLEAARSAGIEIPTICAHEALEPIGACRMCIVAIEGMRGYPTACTTPVADGMNVKTNTPEVIRLRRNILKLLLSGHTSPCLVCLHKELCEKFRPRPTKSGKAIRCNTCSNVDICDLRRLAEEYKVDDLGLPIIYNNTALERDDPFMDRDYNLCILCGRCVRVCKNLHGKPAISIINRGSKARIGTAFLQDHKETGCTFCGACIDICPTGAFSDRFAKWHGKPERLEKTVCTLCPEACELNLKIIRGKIIGASAIAFTREARICAMGRFVFPQLFETPSRLRAHTINMSDGIRKTSYEEAVAYAAEKLKKISGSNSAVIVHSRASHEDIFIIRKFAREVLKTDKIIPGEKDGVSLTSGTKVALSLGNYEASVILDVFSSAVHDNAEVVFAAALPNEREGTWFSASGNTVLVPALVKPPEAVYPDWKILCDIAKKAGMPGFTYESADQIAQDIESSRTVYSPPVKPDPSPRDDVSAVPRYFRGHAYADIVCALNLILLKDKKQSAEKTKSKQHKPFKIIRKQEVAPDTHMITIHTPVIAKKCRAGQFIIAMVHETSERIPYTLVDWDAGECSITINVLEAGRSSREMVLLQEGEHCAHVVGPLGVPVEIRNYGTVVLGGGCFGVGGILPLARALKQAGNKVICIEEASSAYLLYWQDKLSQQCDEFIIVTKDGSTGIKGGVQEVISMLADRGEKIDQAFIIGCTFMMMLVCETTKKLGIPTLTALNPIMVDGTGMCGACRVSVGNETKFSCVDGPFLDGHKINWQELMQRQSAYTRLEIMALPQVNEKHTCKIR